MIQQLAFRQPFMVFNGLISKATMKYFVLCILAIFTLISCNQQPKEEKAKEKEPQTLDEKIIASSKRIESNPTAVAYAERATLYSQAEEFMLAYDDINHAIKLDTANGELHFKAAKILRKAARINASISAAIRATQYGYNQGDVYLLLGENYLIFRQYQSAIDNLNEAMRMDRFNEEIYFYKGMVYKESGSNKEAISSFQTALELNSRYAEAYNQLISIALEDENYDLASTYLESGIRFVPEDPFLWYNQGVCLQQQGFLDSAIVPYQNSFRYDSSQSLAAFNLGWIYHQKGRYKESLAKFNRVLKLEPNNVRALFMKALNHKEMGDNEQCISQLKKALIINPDYAEAKSLYDKMK